MRKERTDDFAYIYYRYRTSAGFPPRPERRPRRFPTTGHARFAASARAFRRGRGAARKARRSPEKERPAAFRRAVSKKSGGVYNLRRFLLFLSVAARCAVKNQINTMMKKILFLMAATAMMWGCDAVKAQTLEPEFEGEVVGVFPDGSSKKLEKHNVRMRTGAGVYIAGFAASKPKQKYSWKAVRPACGRRSATDRAHRPRQGQ